MHFAMKNGNLLAAEIPCDFAFDSKIASDCGCDAVVHLGPVAIYENAGFLTPGFAISENSRIFADSRLSLKLLRKVAPSASSR